MVRTAAECGTPFSEDSFEILTSEGGDGIITFSDGRRFAPKPKLEVLGITVESKGRTLPAVSHREQAATVVWLQHRKWLYCRRVSLVPRYGTLLQGFAMTCEEHIHVRRCGASCFGGPIWYFISWCGTYYMIWDYFPYDSPAHAP